LRIIVGFLTSLTIIGGIKMTNDNFSEIKSYLRTIPEGLLSGARTEQVKQLLSDCWEDLEGSDYTSMSIFKLHRIEEVEFIPPATLEFKIERHGQTVLNSVYADLHKWTINLEEGSAWCDERFGRRVVGKRSKPMKMEPIAEEVKELIISGNTKNEKLEWKSDKKVKVRIAEIIPETVKETTTARRKRFRRALEEKLTPNGWKMTTYNVYEKAV
jgi:hypothetical protein